MSSKTEGLESLGALRREGGSPGFTAQWPGSGPLPAQTGTVLGFVSPTPGPHPTPQLPGQIPAHALQIPHLSTGLLHAQIRAYQSGLDPGAALDLRRPCQVSFPRLWESPSPQPFPHHGLHCHQLP